MLQYSTFFQTYLCQELFSTWQKFKFQEIFGENEFFSFSLVSNFEKDLRWNIKLVLNTFICKKLLQNLLLRRVISCLLKLKTITWFSQYSYTVILALHTFLLVLPSDKRGKFVICSNIFYSKRIYSVRYHEQFLWRDRRSFCSLLFRRVVKQITAWHLLLWSFEILLRFARYLMLSFISYISNSLVCAMLVFRCYLLNLAICFFLVVLVWSLYRWMLSVSKYTGK